jgi:hypothetical protein
MPKSIIQSQTRKHVTEIDQQSLRSRIVEDFIVIWLDSTINESNEDMHCQVYSNIYRFQSLYRFYY